MLIGRFFLLLALLELAFLGSPLLLNGNVFARWVVDRLRVDCLRRPKHTPYTYPAPMSSHGLAALNSNK